MNICLVSQEYPPESAAGGIGTQTFNKARCFARLGHNVHVLSCNWKRGEPELHTETENGVSVHRLLHPGADLPLYNAATNWMAYTLAVLRQLHRLQRMTTFDILDFPEYAAEGYAYQINRVPDLWVPVLVQLYGPLGMFVEHIGWPPKDSEFCRVGTFLEGASIRNADALIACSSSIADFTSRYYDIPRESIDVVYCDVDTDAFHPPDGDVGRNERPTVLFVGGIRWHKGVKTVFDAVMRLRSKYPNILLQVLGRKSDGFARELQACAHRTGATENVEFPGFVDRAQLPDYYRRAHVFASPAQHEPGTANVYLEAMASGCPVVAGTTGGAPEAIIDGQTGILVPFGDAEATAAALDRILSDSAYRARLGEAGRKRAEQIFAMDKCALRVLAAYDKARSRSRAKLEERKRA